MSAADKSKRGWVSKFSKSSQAANTKVAESKSSDDRSAKPLVALAKPAAAKTEQDSRADEVKSKKSWLSFVSKQPKEPKAPKVEAKKGENVSVSDPNKSGRRGLFGMLDGLKLKPPADEPVKPHGVAQTKPVPIKQGQSVPSTQSNNDDDDYEDDNTGRPMSKADRKKLRQTKSGRPQSGLMGRASSSAGKSQPEA